MPTRDRSFRIEAVVLSHTDWGEADRMLRLFSREQGKLRAVAKGIRKLRSRKAGHLEPFTRASIQLARGRDMLLVTQAETVDSYLPLREDLTLLGYSSYVIELLDRFTYEEGEHRALYRLLVDTLSRLASQHEPNQAVRYFEIRLLDLLGFRPQLFACARCENEIKPVDQFFSAAHGGVLCPGCGQGVSGARPISMPALKILRHYQRSSYAEASRASVSAATYAEIEALMHYYLTYLLERGLNTPAFLRRVRKQVTQQD